MRHGVYRTTVLAASRPARSDHWIRDGVVPLLLLLLHLLLLGDYAVARCSGRRRVIHIGACYYTPIGDYSRLSFCPVLISFYRASYALAVYAMAVCLSVCVCHKSMFY